MRFDHKLKACALFLAVAGSLSAFSVEAATSIESKNTEFTKDAATQTLEVKAQSWYNPTMGYTGWTHHSSWGYMNLKKGKAATITATSSVSGFHPAITVWYRPKLKGSAPVNYMASHSYNQFRDILVSKAQLTDDAANPINIGNIQMEFIANAFDRDGMADPLPAAYDQSMLNRSLDGTSGTVSLTFTPKADGVYQFVIGGINPDTGVSTTDFHPVDVVVQLL